MNSLKRITVSGGQIEDWKLAKKKIKWAFRRKKKEKESIVTRPELCNEMTHNLIRKSIWDLENMANSVLISGLHWSFRSGKTAAVLFKHTYKSRNTVHWTQQTLQSALNYNRRK